MNAAAERRLEDGLAGLEGDRFAVELEFGQFRSCVGSQMGGGVVAAGDLARPGQRRVEVEAGLEFAQAQRRSKTGGNLGMMSCKRLRRARAEPAMARRAAAAGRGGSTR